MGDTKTYSKARIAMASGDLMQVTNLKVSTDNSAKTVPTLRRPRGAGVTVGEEKTSVSFDYVIDDDGAERDYIKDLRTGVEIGNTQGVLDGNLDDFVTASLKRGL